MNFKPPTLTMSNEIEQMEATIDANTNALLEASIAVTNLSKENQRLNAQNTMMKSFMRNFCSSFEVHWEKAEKEEREKNIEMPYVEEEMYEYIDSAKFLEKHYGRVSNYVVAVTIYLQNKKV